MAPKNQCGACGEDFTSVKTFDAHRVGVHAYTFQEGLAMVPPREDGRRCLHPEELRAKGFEQDSEGRWFDPVRRDAARERFGTSPVPRTP